MNLIPGWNTAVSVFVTGALTALSYWAHPSRAGDGRGKNSKVQVVVPSSPWIQNSPPCRSLSLREVSEWQGQMRWPQRFTGALNWGAFHGHTLKQVRTRSDPSDLHRALLLGEDGNLTTTLWLLSYMWSWECIDFCCSMHLCEIWKVEVRQKHPSWDICWSPLERKVRIFSQ